MPFSYRSSERVRAVRAQAHDVLEEDLVVGLVHARVVARKLQPDPAEFARAPVDHQRVLLRLVAGEAGEARRSIDGRRSRVDLIVAITRAPHGDELIHALHIPAGLLGVIAVRDRRARTVEDQRAVLVAMEVLAL